jgi:F0F1-type ATP synthase membrane subunit c/vacuolar-type H+-ATPase subunit K
VEDGCLGRSTVAGACAAAGTGFSGQTPVNSCSGEVRSERGCTVETGVGFIAVGAGVGVGAGLTWCGAARAGRAPRACSSVARTRRTRGRVHLPKFLRLQSSQTCESRQMSCARWHLELASSCESQGKIWPSLEDMGAPSLVCLHCSPATKRMPNRVKRPWFGFKFFRGVPWVVWPLFVIWTKWFWRQDKGEHI